MTRQDMEHALEKLPSGANSLLSDAKPFLLDIADELQEDIIGIVCSSPHTRGNSALVVTPTRIIEMTTGGAMQVFPYSELASVRAVPGKKKFFGGYDGSYLLIDSSSGGTRTYPLSLSSDHDWNTHIAAAAEAACKRYRLRAT